MSGRSTGRPTSLASRRPARRKVVLQIVPTSNISAGSRPSSWAIAAKNSGRGLRQPTRDETNTCQQSVSGASVLQIPSSRSSKFDAMPSVTPAATSACQTAAASSNSRQLPGRRNAPTNRRRSRRRAAHCRKRRPRSPANAQFRATRLVLAGNATPIDLVLPCHGEAEQSVQLGFRRSRCRVAAGQSA